MTGCKTIHLLCHICPPLCLGNGTLWILPFTAQVTRLCNHCLVSSPMLKSEPPNETPEPGRAEWCLASKAAGEVLGDLLAATPAHEEKRLPLVSAPQRVRYPAGRLDKKQVFP